MKAADKDHMNFLKIFFNSMMRLRKQYEKYNIIIELFKQDFTDEDCWDHYISEEPDEDELSAKVKIECQDGQKFRMKRWIKR
jgi:hypothetical protein